jgi:hypothetical protein
METSYYLAKLIGRLRNNNREATAKPSIPPDRRTGLSGTASLAGTIATLIFAGCPTTGGDSSGGPSSLAAVQSARTSQNIVAHNEAIAQQQAQHQAAVLEARREAAAIASRNAAADRLALQQEQAKADQQRQQQVAQQQGNQGKGPQGNQGQGPQGNQGNKPNAPPGQANKP